MAAANSHAGALAICFPGFDWSNERTPWRRELARGECNINPFDRAARGECSIWIKYICDESVVPTEIAAQVMAEAQRQGLKLSGIAHYRPYRGQQQDFKAERSEATPSL